MKLAEVSGYAQDGTGNVWHGRSRRLKRRRRQVSESPETVNRRRQSGAERTDASQQIGKAWALREPETRLQAHPV